jgi:hypothetical protein
MLIRRASFTGLIVAVSLVFVLGCRDEDTVEPDINRPPETILTVSPQQGDRVFHKYLVRWTGLDEDGVVETYRLVTVVEDELYGGRTSEEDISEYLLDLDWTTTEATESLFVFRADRPNSRNHSIYIVAIDNEGKEDATPALANFVAIDYELPETEIYIATNLDPVPKVPIAEGDTLPAYNLQNPLDPITIDLSWEGIDPDGEIIEWRYRLDSSSEQGMEAVWEDECECYAGSVNLTYDPNDSLNSDVWLGYHEFRLSAIDDAGARSEQKSARFIINYDPDTKVDSVWSYRSRRDQSGGPYQYPLPEILIYAKEWDPNSDFYDPDSAAKYAGQMMGYHFGQLRVKFHGWDKDGPVDGSPPSQFKWSIRGTLLKSDWTSNECGTADTIVYYCDGTPVQPYLDSDRAFTLIVTARDNHGKADGSPVKVDFEVNYFPEIESFNAQVTDPDDIDVRISWEVSDPDEGYGWGVTQGETEQALVKYRYRYRMKGTELWSLWTQIDRKDRQRRYLTYDTIEGLEAGVYELELHVFNGDYIQTRADRESFEFTIP